MTDEAGHEQSPQQAESEPVHVTAIYDYDDNNAPTSRLTVDADVPEDLTLVRGVTWPDADNALYPRMARLGFLLEQEMIMDRFVATPEIAQELAREIPDLPWRHVDD